MNDLKRARAFNVLDSKMGIICGWIIERWKIKSCLILISPEGHRMHCALKFGFKASNNEAEYEVLIARLKLAKEMKVQS